MVTGSFVAPPSRRQLSGPVPFGGTGATEAHHSIMQSSSGLPDHPAFRPPFHFRRRSNGRCGAITLFAMVEGPYAKCRFSCMAG